MGLLDKIRKQICIYWEPDYVDKFGQIVYKAPVDISCRWEYKNEMFINSLGEEQISSAVVYVGVDIVTKSKMKLGTITTSGFNTDWKANSGVLEVGAFNKIPDIKNKKYLRMAYL